MEQPQKALGHEPQIHLCVANQAPPRLVSLRNRSTPSLPAQMQPRSNHARSAARPKPLTRTGLEDKEISSPSSRERKMSLTGVAIYSPSSAGVLLPRRVLSVIAISRQPSLVPRHWIQSARPSIAITISACDLGDGESAKWPELVTWISNRHQCIGPHLGREDYHRPHFLLE